MPLALPVTSLYAGVAALAFVAMSMLVVRRRRRLRVALGDGGNRLLARTIRGHGNFAEYVPLALLVSGMISLGSDDEAIHGQGNLLMRLRVGAQAVAIALVALLVYLTRAA